MADEIINVDAALADVAVYENITNKEYEKYSNVQKSIASALNDTSQSGNLVDNSKEQLALYNTEITTLLQAYEIELDDINTYKEVLSNYAGKTFDRSKLDAALTKAEKDKADYEQKLQDAEDEYNNSSFFDKLFDFWAAQKKIKYYKKLIKEQEELIKEIEADIESLESIISQTSGLFKDSAPFFEAAEAINTYLNSNYKDGEFDMSGAADLYSKVCSCYSNMATTIENGEEKINKKQIERILSKDANDITNMEYYTVSVALENATEEEIEYLLNLLCDSSEDRTFSPNDRCGNYTQYTINAEKIEKIRTAMSVSSATYLEAQRYAKENGMDEFANSAEKVRGNIIQRSLMLEALANISTFNGNYGKDPYFKVIIDEVGTIQVNYHELKIEGYNYDAHGNPAADASVSVSSTYNESTTMNRAISEAEASMKAYFAGTTSGDTAGKNAGKGAFSILDTKMQEYVQNTVQKQLSMTVSEGLAQGVAGQIPVIGIIITTVVDTAMEIEQTQKSLEFIEKEFSRVENADIWDDFGCVENRVEYNSASNKKYVYYASEGCDTEERLMLYNDMLSKIGEDTKTINDVLSDSNSIFDINNKHLNDDVFIDNYKDVKTHNVQQ